MEISPIGSSALGLRTRIVGEKSTSDTVMIFFESETSEEFKVQKHHDELQPIDLHAGGKLILNREPDSSHVLAGE